MANGNDPITSMVERLASSPELSIEDQVEIAVPNSLRPAETLISESVEIITDDVGHWWILIRSPMRQK
jgi:hypothetical protein